MPTKMFSDLCEEKRNKIVEICIAEFSQHGYINSSTNRIIQNAGISKGSLFKYFKSKEELYFYILDTVIMELTIDLEKNFADLPSDLFERTIKYSELEFAWYIKHPDKCKLITTAFSKGDDTLRLKIEKRYKTQGENIYYKTLKSIDISTLRWDRYRTAEVLKWFLLGFKEDFISRMNTENSVDTLQCEFAKKLKDYIEILKSGLETKK
ncbi:MAG: TetR/AcrR family transcriptional regulator [Flavonifractor plautii]|jgi:TetR/AcrR family transcriptional regulator|uniref:TetR/AcrR family transcriptional regulator n=1 Tax=Flavonifractor plautii TaxID=292800 RepID=UPI0019588434|nr:TetR/AcrR family transcriptional regulator [Flavonifractor plautii]MBM6791469.1 TetR/AcrR family transcriptional regulator [Flavonifractor plautii]MCR1909197.1 TetR/AcrR family transcriptional regulator [Flavonifractor plautii]